MTIFKEPPKKLTNLKFGEEERQMLMDAKWLVVILATFIFFLVGGGWRLFWWQAIHEHFAGAISTSAQTSAWLQFAMYFGILPAIGGFIISAALVDYLTHSKGNRR